jgi:hypothetical protein
MEASEMAALVIANPPSIGGSDPSAPVQMPQASTASRPVARRRTPRLRRPA